MSTGIDTTPWSDDAEKAMLGCLFADPGNLVAEARATLPADAFHHPGHRTIYELMLEHQDKPDRSLDIVTFTTFAADKGVLEKIGGAAFLTELASSILLPEQFVHYRPILLDKMLLRRAQRVCAEALGEVGQYHEDVTTFLSKTENAMFEVLSAAQTRGQCAVGPVAARDVMDQWVQHFETAYRNRGKVQGIQTGIHEIDLTLHGIDDSQGEICTLAGRPGMGKTALASTICDKLGADGVPGAVFSLEMSRMQFMDRVIVGGSEIDTSKCVTGMFDRGEFKRIAERAAAWAKYPVHMNDGASLSTADLRAQVQVLKRKHNIRWIMVDHLHLLKGVGKNAQDDERLRLVECMDTLQFIKKQFKLAVFLMVQLNRETDRKKAGERPVLADLSGSAAIEQYSDHVLFIHRPAYYRGWHLLKDEDKRKWVEDNQERRRAHPELWSQGEKYPDGAGDGDADHDASPGYARQDYEEHAEICVRKNRRGPTPDLAVRYIAEFTRFRSRQAKLFSNATVDRQVNYQSKPKTATPGLDEVFD